MTSRRQTIADEIRSQIVTGQFQAGERLPSETSLASQFKVSTSTLRSALALLQSEGLVDKSHGKGNFVGHSSHRITYIGGGRKPQADPPVDPTLRVTVHASRLQAQGHLIPLMRVPANTELTQFVCIRNEGPPPHSLARIYVPGHLSQEGLHREQPSLANFETGLPLLCPPPTELRERLTARLPTRDEVEILRISPTLAVLDITRVAIDGTGRVVEAALLVLPSHRSDAYFITRPAPTAERREG
ncbi:GntR family transcriptional regulator [Streptomyces sp. NPDC050400]|uniref:GntR family transcriptional regulator n=1 Tax=Streptomyces sp. NPDC050400 TaxID=3365610 RepID=UPI0037874C14